MRAEEGVGRLLLRARRAVLEATPRVRLVCVAPLEIRELRLAVRVAVALRPLERRLGRLGRLRRPIRRRLLRRQDGSVLSPAREGGLPDGQTRLDRVAARRRLASCWSCSARF